MKTLLGLVIVGFMLMPTTASAQDTGWIRLTTIDGVNLYTNGRCTVVVNQDHNLLVVAHGSIQGQRETTEAVEVRQHDTGPAITSSRGFPGTFAKICGEDIRSLAPQVGGAIKAAFSLTDGPNNQSTVEATPPRVSAKRRLLFAASIETTVTNVVEKSADTGNHNAVVFSRRWKPSQQAVRISIAPTEKVMFAAKFDINGDNVDEPAIAIDPRNGLRYRAGLRAYVGRVNELVVSGSYQLLPHLAIDGGYLQYSLEDDSEGFIPTGLDGSGIITPFSWISRYRGLALGSSTRFPIEKVGLEAGFLWYPKMGRRDRSFQRYLGEEYRNKFDFKDVRTTGATISGNISYQLIERLTASVGYSYSWFGSDLEGPSSDKLTRRAATASARVRF